MSTEQDPRPAPRPLSLSQQRARRTRQRAVRVVAGLALLALVGWATWRLVAYGRGRLWERRAREAIARGDYPNAAFWASRLLATRPRTDPTAWRLLADAADAGASPDALLMRARVAQLEPAVAENYFAWAKTALRFGQPDQAGEALALVPAASRDLVPFHSLAAAVALSRGRAAEGEEHFAACVRLEPGNPLHALNLASLQLQRAGNNPAAAAPPRAEIERLAAAHPDLQLPARRALLSDAGRHGDRVRALALAHETEADPRADFNDRLAALGVFHAADDPTYAASLVARQEEALTHPPSVPPLLYWLAGHGQTDVGVSWARATQNQGADALKTIPAQVAVADLIMSQRDWSALRDYVAQLDWKRLDFIRRAMLARVVREQEPAAYPAAWETLSRAVGNQPELALQVARLVRPWGWVVEAEEMLARAADRPSLHQRAALTELFAMYQGTGQTSRLLKVARRQWELNREDPVAQNNFAYLSLLTGEELPSAHELAAALRQRYPQNPSAVSTYAFSTLLRRDPTAGLAALEKLSPGTRQDPAIALVEGLLDAAAGRRDQARESLARVGKAPLLPEERALLQQAQAGL